MSADGFEGTADEGWQARLALRFAAGGARTELVARQHVGPLRVQRPFYPEGDAACHVYILHPPGGVVGGDTLDISVDLERNARALLTTPAATKLYRSGGPRAHLHQTFRAAAGSCLEWLPQETIAFSGAIAELHTRVELDAGARFLGWEMLCLGRPASNERFERGEIGQRIEVVHDGKLVYRERGRYRAGSAVLDAAWGLQGQPVVGTFLCAGRDLAAQLPQLRAAVEARPAAGLAAVSCMGGVTVIRYLGPSTEEGRGVFARVWEALRPLACELPASAPRIWST